MVLQHLQCLHFSDEMSSLTTGFQLQDTSLYVGREECFFTNELQLVYW